MLSHKCNFKIRVRLTGAESIECLNCGHLGDSQVTDLCWPCSSSVILLPKCSAFSTIQTTGTSASLFLPCKQAYVYHLSRVHTYAIIYDICFPLSDLWNEGVGLSYTHYRVLKQIVSGKLRCSMGAQLPALWWPRGAERQAPEERICIYTELSHFIEQHRRTQHCKTIILQ